MKRTILTAVFIILLAFCLTACGCEHEWTDATCKAPKTCSLCAKTEGETIAHKWNAASCETPQTCQVCGLTEGAPSEHKWQAATCTSPKICEDCKITEGKEMGHAYIEETSSDYVSAVSITTQTCSGCGDRMEETHSITSFHDGEYFLMSANEFNSRLEKALITPAEDVSLEGVNPAVDYLCLIGEEPADASLRVFLARRADSDNEKVTLPGYLEIRDVTGDSNQIIPITKIDTRGVMNCVRGPVQKEDAAFITMALVLALDPTADSAAARDIYEQVASEGFAEASGLMYSWSSAEEPNSIMINVGITN